MPLEPEHGRDTMLQTANARFICCVVHCAWRPEERDSSLGGRYFNAKRDPSSIHRDFLEKFDEPRAAEPPTVASNEAGAVSPGISF